MEAKIKALVELLEKDSAFAEQFGDMNAQEAIEALASKGLNLTMEELAQIAEIYGEAQNGELGEEALDDVAGGIMFTGKLDLFGRGLLPIPQFPRFVFDFKYFKKKL